MQTYKIVRYYAKQKNKQPQTIRFGFTLEQAREWCGRKDTHKTGKWFDGYIKE